MNVKTKIIFLKLFKFVHIVVAEYLIFDRYSEEVDSNVRYYALTHISITRDRLEAEVSRTAKPLSRQISRATFRYFPQYSPATILKGLIRYYYSCRLDTLERRGVMQAFIS